MKLEKRILESIREGGFKITQGDNFGDDFTLLKWQREFIKNVFGNPDVSTAALTLPRGAGKSTFAALIAALAVDGPLESPRADVLICASSFQQGCIIGRSVLAFLGKRKHLKVVQNSHVFTITNKNSGVILRVASSDYRRLHGISSKLCLLDEGAMWPPSGDLMYSALKTSLGKIPNSKLIAIGTRPQRSDHWFSELLDGGADVIADYSLPKNSDPTNKKLWSKANPSLYKLPSLRKQMHKELKEAKKSPFIMAQFKALRLNMGTPETVENLVLSVENWELAIAKELPPKKGPMILGIDLGGAAAMSSFSCYWIETGRLEVVSYFPSIPDLKNRALQNGAGNLYEKMFQRGELKLSGERVINIHGALEEVFTNFGFPKVIVADRYKQAELTQELDRTKCPRSVDLVFRGMGYRSGDEDIRLFQKAVLSGKVKTTENLSLSTALATARVLRDPAGNQKICKNSEGGRRSGSKDDVLCATIVGVAEGMRRLENKTKEKPLRLVVV